MSPADIQPIPKLKAKSTNNQRRSNKQHSNILTSTPKKYALIEAEKKKKDTKMEALKCSQSGKNRKKITQDKKQLKIKQATRKLFHDGNKDSDSTISNDEKDDSIFCVDSSDEYVIEKNNVNECCLICEEVGRDKELWFRCVCCGRWAHEACSGWNTAEDYTCDLCFHAEKKRKNHVSNL